MSPQLREKFSKPENQGDSGICFAITTMALWSYQTDQYFSGLYFWSQYAHDYKFVDIAWRRVSNLWGDNTIVLDGGMLSDALKLAQRLDGLCPNEIVKTTLERDTPGSERTPRLDQYRLVKSSIANPDPLKANELLIKSQFAEYFPTLTYQNVFQETREMKKSNIADLIYNLGTRACEKQKVDVKNLPAIVRSFKATSSDLIPIINKELSKSPRPNMVGVMYDNGTTVVSGRPSPFAYLVGVHVSPIIGRAFNYERGYCEYLIRDSFGLDTQQYIEGRDAFKTGPTKTNGYQNMIRPNGDGTFWISDYDLYRSAAAISYLEERK